MLRKIKFWLILGMVVIALGLAAALSGRLFDVNLQLPFILKNEKRAQSMALLQEIKDIYTLATVLYTHRGVFPHDYLPDEGTLTNIITKHSQGKALTYQEARYYYVYQVWRNIGVDAVKDPYAFIVISLRLRAGIDLSPFTLKPSERDDNDPTLDGADRGPILTVDNEKNHIILAAPQAIILNIEIVDPEGVLYGYPDIRITPESWKEVTQIVENEAYQYAENQGILDVAEKRGRNFLRELFSQSGWDQISFKSMDGPLLDTVPAQ